MKEHEIEASMHLADEGDVWAYGYVTVDQSLCFSVQMRKYKDPKTRKETSFLSYPGRQVNGKWEAVVSPDQALKKEINIAVNEAIKRELTKDLYPPEPEEVHVTLVDPAPSPNAKVVLCGLATVKICGITINGIAVKQGEHGLFCNMPQYHTKMGTYKDTIYGTSRAMQRKIAEAVLNTYQETRTNAEQTVKEESMRREKEQRRAEKKCISEIGHKR